MKGRVTMFYCKTCRRLRETSRCGICGAQGLPAPRAQDFCFVEEQPLPWAGMLEDVLRQERIPLLAESSRAAGLGIKAGHWGETVSFYVPYACYDQARALADTLFHTGDSLLPADAPDAGPTPPEAP